MKTEIATFAQVKPGDRVELDDYLFRVVRVRSRDAPLCAWALFPRVAPESHDPDTCRACSRYAEGDRHITLRLTPIGMATRVFPDVTVSAWTRGLIARVPTL